MEEDEHIFGWLVGTPPIPPVWKTLKSALKPDSTYHVQILSWKLLSLIYHSATSCWLLKEDNFYLNKFLKTMDNVLIVTENKSLLWNYSYSDKSSFFKIWILLLQFLRQQSIYWILHNGPIAKMLSKYSHQFAKSIYFIWLLG